MHMQDIDPLRERRQTLFWRPRFSLMRSSVYFIPNHLTAYMHREVEAVDETDSGDRDLNAEANTNYRHETSPLPSPTLYEHSAALRHIVNMTSNSQIDREESEGSKLRTGIYQPTFWWFTETAFPLIAGTFGPVANLFSVCSLIWTWRVRVDDGGRVPDPAWLTVLNSCSLAVSFAANMALLLNFARRIPYHMAQLITISFWYLASILLLIPITLTHLPSIHPDPSAPLPVTITHNPLVAALGDSDSQIIPAAISTDKMAYSQAYYYGLISCIFYALISTLLLWNVLGAYKFHAYPPSFAALTSSQRTLMLQTMAFVLYLAIGGGVFAAIQDWDFEDAIYWADYTLLTIGLGSDFPLTTVRGRIIAVPYITFGICFLGLVVGSVRGLVVERAKYKFSRRYLGKARQRLGGKLRSYQDDALGGHPAHVDRTSRFWHRLPIGRTTAFFWAMTFGPRTVPLNIRKEVLEPWHRAEFELMRLIESTAERRQRFTSLSVAFLAFLLVWLVGAVVFWVCESKSQEWTYATSLYFSYTTLLTVGYGDFYPTSPSGKPFFVAWSLVAVPTMTVFIGTMADTVGVMIRDASIWLGGWTILPERYTHPIPAKRSLYRRHNIITRRKYTPHLDPSVLAGPRSNVKGHPTPQITHIEDVSSNHTASQVPVNTHPRNALNPPSNSTSVQPAAANDIHGYWRRPDTRQNLALELSRAVGDLSSDLGESPPRRYSWNEWVYFLELLYKWPSTARAEATTVTGGQSREIDRWSARLKQVSTKSGFDSQRPRPSLDHDSIMNTEVFEGRRQRMADEDEWTWLSDNGPLFSKLTETEWLIERVCWRLEEVLDNAYAES